MHGLGADGLLSVTPYYNKPTQEGLYQHYAKIAEATPLPIVVYNVPGPHRLQRRGADAAPARHAFPTIIGVKEASGNITQMCESAAPCPTTSWCSPATMR